MSRGGWLHGGLQLDVREMVGFAFLQGEQGAEKGLQGICFLRLRWLGPWGWAHVCFRLFLICAVTERCESRPRTVVFCDAALKIIQQTGTIDPNLAYSAVRSAPIE